MYEHSDLVHQSFPKPASETRLAGDVVSFPKQSSEQAQKANADAAKKGGVGYDPANVDFKLLDKLGK